MIVYQITNLVNGKRYIGMTCQSLAQRWMEHRNTAQKGSRTALHSAIRKYGADSFVASILVSLPAESERAALCDAEKLMIQREGTLAPVGYNLTPGGDGLPKGALNPNVGKKASLAHVEKLKLSWTPERREAMRKRRVAYNIQKIRPMNTRACFGPLAIRSELSKPRLAFVGKSETQPKERKTLLGIWQTTTLNGVQSNV